MLKKLRPPTNEELKYLQAIKFSHGEIESRAEELTARLKSSELGIDLMICMLDGAFFWANLLQKHLDVKQRIDVNVSWYQSGRISLTSDGLLENLDVANKSILVVEDLVATGRTLAYVIKSLLTKQPRSLKICAMVDNPQVRQSEYLFVNKYLKYVGFRCKPDEFLVGWGIKGMPPLATEMRYLQDIYLSKSLPGDYCYYVGKDKRE